MSMEDSVELAAGIGRSDLSGDVAMALLDVLLRYEPDHRLMEPATGMEAVDVVSARFNLVTSEPLEALAKAKALMELALPEAAVDPFACSKFWWEISRAGLAPFGQKWDVFSAWRLMWVSTQISHGSLRWTRIEHEIASNGMLMTIIDLVSWKC